MNTNMICKLISYTTKLNPKTTNSKNIILPFILSNKTSTTSSFTIVNYSQNNSKDDNNINMSEKKFWDNFYKKHKSQPFEWLIDYKDLIKSLNFGEEQNVDQKASTIFLNLNVEQKSRSNLTFLLDVGCGTSLFSYNLKNSLTFKSFLVCADFSYEALEILKLEQPNQTTTDFVQCNCKYLPFRDTFFELIIDKGYLDSLLKSASLTMIKQTLNSIENILEKLENSSEHNKRVLLQITDEIPELRTSLFDQIQSDKFKLSYYFKEIDLGNNHIYFAYFLYKE